MSSLHKTVLFVGTKQHCKKLLEDLAEATNSPYVTQKWICGLLTNYKTIKKRIRHLKNLEEDEKSGEIQKYTKKEQLKLKKEKEKLQMSLGGVKEMQSPPDVLFVVDATRDRNAIIEANKLRIPVVSIVDTCSDPEMVDYVIPANDDALKSLIYILNLVKTVLLEGKQKKQAKKEEKKDEQKDEQKEIEQKSETKALL